jgi:RNA polymerase sigma-70 factor (ECF subfamily)
MNMEQNDFENEVRLIRPKLYLLAFRYVQNEEDAEDVTQDVLLKLWSIRQTLEEYRSVEALAMVITKHICLNRLRENKYLETGMEETEKMEDPGSPEESLIEQEEYDRLMKVMDQLPDIQQATLRMKHIDGLEVEEIARITGTKEVTVRTNLSRARKKIMNYFINDKI